ncbi:ATP-binding protein [Streptomyces sp. NBC_00513]|uniref:ATP-binding protein n=2 Tax=unclassified Streptomyces TaxID=2593676 RepID=UPI00352F89AE|nr:ATP-binding protein [Streptomyces sp. NBC_00513]
MTNHSMPVTATAVAPAPAGIPPTSLTRRAATTDPAAGCPRQALLTLPAETKRVRIAREFTADVLSRWQVSGDDRDSAVLIVSELATNAALYGHAELTVRLALSENILHVAVADCGRPPASRAKRPGIDPIEHGRGMDIVECLAHWTDVRQEADGRRVHAHLLLAAQ